MDVHPLNRSPDSGVHEPHPEDGLTEQDLKDLHEDILDENEENVRQLLKEIADDGLSITQLCHSELQIEPLAEDHELNRISLSALHRAALLDSNSILTLLLGADSGVDANLPLKTSGYCPLHVASLAGVPAAASYLAFNGAKVNVKDNQGQTPIHLCAKNGHVDIAKVLVVKGGQIDCVDFVQRTPLHYACEEGQVKFVTFLLKKNVECQATDKEGQTPLHCALVRGQDDVVEALLGAHAPVNAQDHLGNSPLHTLLASADPKGDKPACGDFDYCLDLLLSSPTINIHLTNNEGHTPLHVATSHNYGLAVKQLLAMGANVNTADNNQETPLFLARSLEGLELLLASEEVNIEVKNHAGDTALHKFARSDQVSSDMLGLLLTHDANMESINNCGETPIFQAGLQGNLDKISVLLDHGARRDVVDSEGKTLLHVVIEQGHCQIAKHMLEKNHVRVDLQDKRLRSALHLAIQCTTDRDLVVKLVESNADVNAVDDMFQSPADLALKKHDMETLRFLLCHSAKLSNVNSHLLLVYANDEDLDVVKELQNQGMGPGLQNAEKQNLLHLAILNEAWSLTLHLIQCGARCDLADSKGNTPLHLAAKTCPQSNIIDELVTNSTSINKRNHLGLTPLHNAVVHNSIDVVEMLVQFGAKIDAQDKELCTPMHACGRAAAKAHQQSDSVLLQSYKDKFEFLLDQVEKGDPEMNMTCKQGCTLLHLASQIGDKALVHMCLTKGALVDKADVNGMQALHFACSVGGTEAVSLLLNANAPVNHMDGKGLSPLFYAVLSGIVDIVEELLEHEAEPDTQRHSDGNTPLHQALIKCSGPIAEALLMHEANLDLQNQSGQSALHLAAKHGTRQIVIAVTAQDPDACLKDKKGCQPIHYAVQNPDVSIIKVILSAGGSIDALDNDGNTPLLLSAKEGSYDHMSVLLENHADVNRQDNHEKSSLHYVLEHEETDLLELLIANEADINALDSNGQAPLLCALIHENLEGAQVLLDQRADVHLYDNLGESALHKAVNMPKVPVHLLRTLCKRGCDFHLQNKAGKTSLSILETRQDLDVEDILHTLDITA